MFSSNTLYPRTIPCTWSGGACCQVTENDVEFNGLVVTLIGAWLGTEKKEVLYRLRQLLAAHFAV